jgi:hypothetical protein
MMGEFPTEVSSFDRLVFVQVVRFKGLSSCKRIHERDAFVSLTQFELLRGQQVAKEETAMLFDSLCSCPILW